LAVQTRYNRLALDALEALQKEIADLAARLASSEAQTGPVAGSVASNTAVVASREDAYAQGVPLSKAILEYTFVLNHLPAPPARILLVGSAACGLQRELASLGYLPNGIAARAVQGRLATASIIVARPNSLPFSDQSIDAVVWLGAERSAENGHGVGWSGALDEGRRVLRPNGRLIVTFPMESSPGGVSGDHQQFDALFPAFRRVQTVFCTGSAESCLLTTRVALSEPASMTAATSLTALVAAEKH
jgi:hypothetical protein